MKLAPLYSHCRNCGKPLTNPKSRRLGIGPECRKGQPTKQPSTSTHQLLARSFKKKTEEE